MQVQDILEQARDNFTVKRMFGEPYTEDGVTVIPVAQIMGGVGAGSGEGNQNGAGGGLGLRARPAGVYVIKDGNVTWRPALDVNRIVAGGQLIVAIFLLVIRSMVNKQAKRRVISRK